MVNLSESEAELFFTNRLSHGFNAVWINLLCRPGTGGRAFDRSRFERAHQRTPTERNQKRILPGTVLSFQVIDCALGLADGRIVPLGKSLAPIFLQSRDELLDAVCGENRFNHIAHHGEQYLLENFMRTLISFGSAQ